MTLNNKKLILVGMLWAAFFILVYISPEPRTLYIFTPIAIALTVFLLLSLNHEIKKRIKKLKTEITMNASGKPIDITGEDELADIARQINQLLTNIQVLHEQLADKLHETQPNASHHVKNKITPASQSDRYENLITLPNRILFNEILNRTINHATRHHTVLAILIIDIEPINKENALLSENAIREIGNYFAKVLRKEDVIAKLDGNEFVVLLNDIKKPKFASAVAEKILKTGSPLIKKEYKDIFAKMNIGISTFPDDGRSLEEIIEGAYKALSQAKCCQESTYQFYSDSLDTEAREYIQMNTDLRKAVQEKKLTIYYQPILNIKSGTITGLEALLRWDHPTLGAINPAKFIPIAEEAGLINQIGEWALLEICKMNKYWQDEGYEHMTVSLNMSSKQLYHPDLQLMIENAIKESGLKPNYLELEITESTMMDDLEKTTQVLDKIKKTGVHISVDHFGTGYTSISHLKRLPITFVKIDQNFIKGIPNNQTDMAITSAIIALAHNLGLKTIAEGVETAEQVQFLAEQNCDMVQGYFLSYPFPPESIVKQFKKLTDRAIMY